MSFLMENWQNSELAAIRMGFGEGLVDIAKKNLRENDRLADERHRGCRTKR